MREDVCVLLGVVGALVKRKHASMSVLVVVFAFIKDVAVLLDLKATTALESQ